MTQRPDPSIPYLSEIDPAEITDGARVTFQQNGTLYHLMPNVSNWVLHIESTPVGTITRDGATFHGRALDGTQRTSGDLEAVVHALL